MLHINDYKTPFFAVNNYCHIISESVWGLGRETFSQVAKDCK